MASRGGGMVLRCMAGRAAVLLTRRPAAAAPAAAPAAALLAPKYQGLAGNGVSNSSNGSTSSSGSSLSSAELSTPPPAPSSASSSPYPSCALPISRCFSSTSPSSSSQPQAVNEAWYEVYNRQRQLLPLNQLVPEVAVDAWVAPNAVLVGGVTVHDGATIWHNVVLRADLNYITVGAYSNLQDGVIVHAVPSVATGLSAETRIGRSVTVGQKSVLRSCEVEDEAVVGQRCIVLEGAVVEKHAVLADASLVAPGQLIPSGQLWAGSPAKFVRELSADERVGLAKVAEAARATASEYTGEFLPQSFAYVEAERLRETLEKLLEKGGGRISNVVKSETALPPGLGV